MSEMSVSMHAKYFEMQQDLIRKCLPQDRFEMDTLIPVGRSDLIYISKKCHPNGQNVPIPHNLGLLLKFKDTPRTHIIILFEV